ncbi:MAG TPA: hypothetical protein VMB50_07150, partial [Myxococcales bacterium]|nr:hypothetical protein [Myxococcales bacterium]
MLATLAVLQLLATGPASPSRRRADQDFARGRYAQAAEEYLQADRASPRAALVLQAARSFERAGDLAQAVQQYRAYLRRAPFTAKRAAVRRTIAKLNRQLAAQAGA